MKIILPKFGFRKGIIWYIRKDNSNQQVHSSFFVKNNGQLIVLLVFSSFI